MLSSTASAGSPPQDQHKADRFGVIASVLCAIHCALAPIFLIFMPAFGRIWAHPASHWLVALIVIPVAAVMIHRGYLKHGKKWVIACGGLGILLIIAGAFLPYVEGDGSLSGIAVPTPFAAEAVHDHAGDDCCPAAVAVDDKAVLLIPPASIVTTLGGLALIVAHLANLCACRGCAKEG